MSEKTLKKKKTFEDIAVNKKEFHASKPAINLGLEDTDQRIVPVKFKYSDNGSKYFFSYLDDDNISRALCIILPQMSRYIKYIDNGGKNMSFRIENEVVHLKYNEIWNKIKKALN